MNTPKNVEIPMNLRLMSYKEAEEILVTRNDEDLIEIMAGASRKLGDTAFSILQRRGKSDLVVARLRQGYFRTRDAKVRALNFILSYGREIPASLEICSAYVMDRSKDVFGTALFGLVFWQNKAVIPRLMQLASGDRVEEIRKAIDAIESGNVKKYCPYFHDSSGVWTKKG